MEFKHGQLDGQSMRLSCFFPSIQFCVFRNQLFSGRFIDFMDNLVMAKPTGVGGLKNWTSSTLNGGQSTSSSIVEGDTRSRNQSCRAKVIGPFEGDNNNNDGDMLDRRMHQKNMTIATNMPALDLVASKTNKIERTISLKAASATASIKRDCPKSRESTSIQHHHRKSIPQAQQRQGSSPRAGLLTDVQRGITK